MNKSTEDVIKEISESLSECLKQYIGNKNDTNTQKDIKKTVTYVCEKPLDRLVATINIDD